MTNAVQEKPKPKPKPKPVQVGTIQCRHHEANPVQARLKKSLKTNKLFIDCPACGLIMPTLPAFQDFCVKNGSFTGEFSQVYGNGEKYNGGPEPAPDLKEDEAPEPLKENAPEKNAADVEMGF